jgi:hypothetical protein
MNILKRLLNVFLVLTVTAFVVVLSTLLITSYNRKLECDANRALLAVCATISIEECAKTREAKRLGENFKLALFLTPLYCSDDQPEYWQSNLVRYAGFYSSVLVAALLLLLVVNYVIFGTATLWHKVKNE